LRTCEGRVKKEIVVYEKDRLAVEALKDFFKGNRSYAAEFVGNARELKKRLADSSPDVVIAGSPHGLEKVHALSPSVPVLAVVSPDSPESMRGVVRNGVEHYIMAPFHRDDLQYKLVLASREKDYLETLYQEKKDLEAIVDLTYVLSSTLEPREVLYLVVKKLSQMMQVSRCSILSIGTAAGRFANVVSSFEDPSITDLKLDLNKYPEIKKALRANETVIITDAVRDPLMSEVKETIARLGIKSIVVIPVVFRDEVVGTLFLRTSRKRRVFSDREITLCKKVAKASSNALNNAFLFEKVKTEKSRLEKLAVTDFLTGVYNIRYFYHRLDDEFSRAQRYETPLSCMMFDIDHFKKINDTYGHRVGDMVLREFAKLVKRHTRKSDTFARYGGEEFILLLPNTSLEGAVAEGRRLGEAIKKHRFKGLKAESRITVSIGIAATPHKKITTQDILISYADDALLMAKAKGRDQIIVKK
jgi:two-component system cell cycle response regulator